MGFQEQISGESAFHTSMEFVIDNRGLALTAGLKGMLVIPFDGVIIAAELETDQNGNVVVDIWKDIYANYPPTVADTITASAKPTLSGAKKYQDTTLAGWTTAVTKGDIVAFNIDSVATITRLTITLYIDTPRLTAQEDPISGVGIVWLGSFASAPGSPATNNAYRNTTDGKVYIYNGASWQEMTQDGTNGSNGQGFNWRGAWVSGQNYAAYDVCTNSGSCYQCILAINNSTTVPGSDSTHFSLLAQKGDTGASGGGNFSLIASSIDPSADTSLTLSGLNGDSDVCYDIIAEIQRDTTNGGWIRIRLNADTGSNYTWACYGWGNGSGAGKSDSDTTIHTSDSEGGGNGLRASKPILIRMTIWAVSGYYRTVQGRISYYCYSDSYMGGRVFDAEWKNTADNLTSITFVASTGKIGGAGTTIKAFKVS